MVTPSKNRGSPHATKTKMLSVLLISLVVVALWGAMRHARPLSWKFQPESSGPILPNASSNVACDLAKSIFGQGKRHYQVDESLTFDEPLSSNLVVAMSDNGLILAMSNGTKAVRFYQSPEYDPTLPYERTDAELALEAAGLTLSGDGQFLLVRSEHDAAMFRVVDAKRIPLPALNDMMSNIISDMVMSRDGSRMALARTFMSTPPGYEEAEWASYWLRPSSNMHGIWAAEYIGFSVQPDTFRLAMSSDGSAMAYVAQMTDHLTKMTNLMIHYRTKHDNSWDTANFHLNHMCAGLLTDIAMSSDGQVLVFAVQCFENKKVRVYLHVAVREPMMEQEGYGYVVPFRRFPVVVRELYSNSLRNMSLTMSGDASVTVLAVDGTLLEVFEGDFWNHPSHSHSVGPYHEDTVFSVAVSKYASTILLATANAVHGGSVCLIKTIELLKGTLPQ